MKGEGKKDRPLKKKLKGSRRDNKNMEKSTDKDKQVLSELRGARAFAEGVFDTIREPLVVLDADLRVISANRAFYRTFKLKTGEIEGMLIYELGNRQWDIPQLREFLEQILPKKTSFDGFEVEYDFPGIGQRTMLLNARRIYHGPNKTRMILLAIEDITERRQAEEKIEHLNRVLRAIQDINQLITREKDEDKLLQAACNVLVEVKSYIGTSITYNNRTYYAGDKKKCDRLLKFVKKKGIEKAKKIISYSFDGSYLAASPIAKGDIRAILYIVHSKKFNDEELGLLEEISGDIAFALHDIEMEEAQLRLAAIVEDSDDAIISKTLEGKIVSWNKAAERMYGYFEEEILGKTISILIPSDRQKELLGILRRIQHGERIDHFRTFRIRKDGKKIPVSATISPIKNAEGLIIGASTIARDISKQKEYEEKIHLNEVLRAIRSVNQLITRERDEDELLQAACDVLVEVKSYIGASITYNNRTYYAGDKKKCDRLLKFVRKKGIEKAKKISSYSFDGSYLVASPIAKGDIRAILYIVHSKKFNDEELGLLEEISGDIAFGLYSIKTEREKGKMKIILRDSEEKYRTLVESANDGICIVQDGVIRYANRRFIEAGGYRRDELIGGIFSDFIITGDVRRLMQKHKRRLTRKSAGEIYETTLLRKDGNEVPVELSVAVTNFEGKPAALAVIRDITKRKQAEQTLRESFEKSKRILKETVDALALAVGKRDLYTAGHQRRVASLSEAIAREMGLSQECIDGIVMAAIVHDVGKIYVPTQILTKPEQLTEAEFSIVKSHSQVGYDILKDIEFPWPVAEIILQHHERLDGSGYPQGLKDGEILCEAKVLGVADVVEAMLSHRPYRPAPGLDAALEEITRNKNILYDPAAVDACLRIMKGKKLKLK